MEVQMNFVVNELKGKHYWAEASGRICCLEEIKMYHLFGIYKMVLNHIAQLEPKFKSVGKVIVRLQLLTFIKENPDKAIETLITVYRVILKRKKELDPGQLFLFNLIEKQLQLQLQ
jgi:hypothetical protein